MVKMCPSTEAVKMFGPEFALNINKTAKEHMFNLILLIYSTFAFIFSFYSNLSFGVILTMLDNTKGIKYAHFYNKTYIRSLEAASHYQFLYVYMHDFSLTCPFLY